MSLVPGTRCRSARTITFSGGIVRRATAGTLDLASHSTAEGTSMTPSITLQKLILFAHEIEPVSDELAA